MDTAGQEEYSPLRDSHMHTGDGFIIVYSVTTEPSFEQVAKLHRKILRLRSEQPDFPIIIVGNKIDMQEERVVSTEQGIELAKKLNVIFIEISAKTGEGVSDVFTELVRAINKWRQLHPVTKPKKELKCIIL